MKNETEEKLIMLTIRKQIYVYQDFSSNKFFINAFGVDNAGGSKAEMYLFWRLSPNEFFIDISSSGGKSGRVLYPLKLFTHKPEFKVLLTEL